MKLPKYLVVCGEKYIVKQDTQSNGGSFDTFKREIVIGTIDKPKVLAVLLHEVTELVFSIRNLRYTKQVVDPDNGDILFSFDHEQFNQAMEDVAATLKSVF